MQEPIPQYATEPALFMQFAHTAEQVRGTTKRLEKAATLGAYFVALSDDDLHRAARWFAGYVFSLRDHRVTNIGGAALIAALVSASGVEEAHIRTRLVTLGDAGDVAGEVWTERAEFADRPGTWTLADVEVFLHTLSETSGSKKKTAQVTEMLQSAAPLEAKYLVKLLQGDLRIGLKEGAVEDALARMSQVTAEQVQWANMLTGDTGKTAILARYGRLGEARMALFHPIKFMLASPTETLNDITRQMPPEFVVEDKFDGIRAQAHVAPIDGDEVRVALFTRTLDEVTHSYPDLIKPLAELVQGGINGVVLDGEIVPVQGDTILPFQDLQQRLGRKTLTDDVLARVPVAFVAYDALYVDGEILINEPFGTRRAALERLPFDGDRTRRADSKWFTDALLLDAEFDAARARGNEGLMVKDPASLYKPGRRGREWLKVKRAMATLDVVITAAQVGEGRRSRFLSDYTFAVRASETDGTLLNVGKAYSGLTDLETQALSDWCRAHILEEFAHGKVVTVTPETVLEVTFDRVQPSSRHKSGYALRFPRILRIRDDKGAGEIDTLQTVKRLAQISASDEAPETEESS